FFFSSRRRHTRSKRDWSSDVCSSDLFHKIWLGHMLESLDMIGNQKIRVAMFIMENINKENELIMTYRVIAEKTNTSLQTVSETMKALQESNLLSKIRNGYYR